MSDAIRTTAHTSGALLAAGGAGATTFGMYQAYRHMRATDDLATGTNLHGWAAAAERVSQGSAEDPRSIRAAVDQLATRFESTGQHDVARAVRAAAAHPDMGVAAQQLRGVADIARDEVTHVKGGGKFAAIGCAALISGLALLGGKSQRT